MSVFKHILVPFDKSKNAFNAMEKAVDLAREDSEIRVDIVYVTDLPEAKLHGNFASYAGGTEPSFPDINGVIKARSEALETEREEISEMISECIADIKDQTVLTLIPGSSPIDDIVEFADEHECDLIVMGSRGLGAIRGILGSVSTGVLRYAKMPVLVVK